MLLRWGGCSQWTAKNTDNQQSSEILNHDESWTRTLRLLRWMLRAHQINSAKYSKANINLLFLFIVCLVLLVSFSFYGNYLANCFLFICLRARRTETGSKGKHFKHKWPKMFTKAKCFHSCACFCFNCDLVFLTVAFSFPLQHAKNVWALEKFCHKSNWVGIRSEK